MNDRRDDFPILKRKINKESLIYFDNAATTQKPQSVIDTINDFYTNYNSNVFRAVNTLGEEVTTAYSAARQKVANFIGANFDEVVFTSGATEAINFVATSWGSEHVGAGDEIILTVMEHHSNILPWQNLAQHKGAKINVVGLDKNFNLDIEQYKKLINKKTKLVAVSLSSNVLGTINDLSQIIAFAKAAGVAVMVDAAQATPYIKIDVEKLNCDFLAISPHKMLAPTGVGILYIADKWLNNMSPYQFGGGMVSKVSFGESKWLPSPERFEAGTPPIAQIIGLGAAVDYYNQNINWQKLADHVDGLCEKLIDGLKDIPQIKILGSEQEIKKRGHLVSFVFDGYHPHDIAAYLDQFAICVRAGHHCAQPLHDYLGIGASVRVSFHLYNTEAEVERLLSCLHKLAQDGL